MQTPKKEKRQIMPVKEPAKVSITKLQASRNEMELLANENEKLRDEVNLKRLNNKEQLLDRHIHKGNFEADDQKLIDLLANIIVDSAFRQHAFAIDNRQNVMP